MSTKARVLAENLFSKTQFPDHTIVGNEEPTGNEAFRIANGRRATDDFWTSNTANADANVKVTCDRVRGADMAFLDRGHNLDGETFKIEGSDDDFTTIDTAVDITLPSQSSTLPLDNATGVKTEAGAWVMLFPFRAHKYWRAFVSAMGAGLKPQIVGLSLGLSWEFPWIDLPYGDNVTQLVVSEVESDAGWLGRSWPNTKRVQTARLKLDDFYSYGQARYHLEGRFGGGAPMVLVPNQEQADRTLVVVRPKGQFGFRIASGWGYQQAEVAYVESQPKRVAL